MTVREAKITSTDNDLTGIVTGLRGDGVKAIVLTTTPGQTGVGAVRQPGARA